MGAKNFLILLVFLGIIFTGCRNGEQSKIEKSKELISVKTLGLAYLEEFRLEEAEKEFLKFIKLAPGEKLGYANLGLTYLRMGRYEDAKTQLLKAISIDSKDADIRLILATVYQMNEEKDKAVSELQDALTFAPVHVKVLYFLSELFSPGPDTAALNQKEKYTKMLVRAAPWNLVPYLNLVDIQIKKGEADSAYANMETVKKQFPEFPKEAAGYYDKTISDLAKRNFDDAIIQFTIFHNYLKVTSPYQAGIMDLKGPGGSLIGFPLISFAQQTSFQQADGENSYTVIKFTDATALAGLEIAEAEENITVTEPPHSEASDFDNDGDIDIYAGIYSNSKSAYSHYLFLNETGRYRDIASEAGIDHEAADNSAEFVDYDNDGFLDLFVTSVNGDILYRNSDKGIFRNVTRGSNIGLPAGGSNSMFFDYDHDGDLDLFEMSAERNYLFRNNADGTFTESSAQAGVDGKNLKTRDAAFGDFDEDGDIDFITSNEAGSNILYSNQRQGVFRDVTSRSGLESEGGSSTVAAGDYNNDGYLDLFTGAVKGGQNRFFINRMDGSFRTDDAQSGILSLLKEITVYDAAFLDYDNDGFNDILVAGEPSSVGGKGLFLFRNDSKGGFTDVSSVFPENVKHGRKLTVFDYNGDGDLDIIVAGMKEGIRLLRNDGGNNNHFIRMKLVGIRTGSAKNNYFGIGAKVEMRSGDLYNTMVVTDPEIHFGLGSRSNADIIRITWTNGVPQNIFMPGSDQSIVESQILKGSCPFLYTWNGEEYVFAKDIIWRSALGMPLGIMGETTEYAFADASDDYIKIPGELLRPKNGEYSVQVTSELWETIYTDKIDLIAVDHPESIDIFVPEQFSPPPFPGMKLYVTGRKITPSMVYDSYGFDLVPYISEQDNSYIPGGRPEKYQGITKTREIILDPGKEINPGNCLLLLTGWIFPTDASINYALSQQEELKIIHPEIQVINGKGNWETVDRPGFPMGKDKTVISDLSGKFPTADRRVRIITNMDIHWDHIFFSTREPGSDVMMNLMKPVSADLHYRGFSAGYRKGGVSGPHWFNYRKADTEPKWRDLQGNYTRYGDVIQLLQQSDNMYIISNAGDEVTVSFSSTGLPELKSGWKRDFLVHSVGWVKDGDINTSTGNTVLPLPFHGMKRYPPSASDKYPDTPELRKYNAEYNTRVVNSDGYLNALKTWKRADEK